ncbi:MAG: hypothetical protein STHCBS139747_002901 [Sporothrix thermara]
MSSRQLKKLRAQEELAAQKRAAGALSPNGSADDDNEDDDDGSSEDEVVVARPRAVKNVFAAFAALGDEDQDEDEEDEEADEPRKDEEETSTRPAAAKVSEKKKKKKKKKKSGKVGGGGGGGGGDVEVVMKAATAPVQTQAAAAAGGGGVGTGGSAATATVVPQTDLDEIDRALQELALKPVKARTAASAAASALATGAGATAPSHRAKAIKINFADLRVSNELREVFGREAMQAAAAEEAQGVPGQRQRPGHNGGGGDGPAGMIQMDLETFLRAPPPPPRGMVYVDANGQQMPKIGRGGVADAVARRNPFVQWKDTWPRGTSGGLSMRRADAGDEDEDFAFVHSPAYQHLEDTFLTLVMMHNPQPLIQFLRQHPFHIASLIQISRVAKLQDQNASLAADLCERALFSFGRSALSSFRQALADGGGNSGRSRSRLSFYRPENRQFVLAGYHYIVSLMGLGTYRTALAWTKLFLTVMPHDEYALLLYAQSLAVRAFEARWLVEYLGGPDIDIDDNDDNKNNKNKNNAPLALTENPMAEYIRQSLVPALLQIKNVDAARAVLARGLARLPWLYGALFQALGLDVPRAVWGITPRSDAETLYTQLYLHLARDLWDGSSAARSLLQEVAAAAATPKITDAAVAALAPAAPVSLAIARFVYLDATPGLMALVPQDMLHAAPNYDFDPLPPPLEHNIFSNPSQKRPWIMAASDAEHQHIRQLPDGFVMPGQLMDEFDMVEDDFDEEEGEGGGEDDDEDDYLGDDWDGGEAIVGEGEESQQQQHQQESQQAQGQAQPRQNTGGGGEGMPGAWIDDE